MGFLTSLLLRQLMLSPAVTCVSHENNALHHTVHPFSSVHSRVHWIRPYHYWIIKFENHFFIIKKYQFRSNYINLLQNGLNGIGRKLISLFNRFVYGN